MSKPFVKSFSVLMALTLALPVYASPFRVPQSETAAMSLHGLEKVGIDGWTKFLVKGKNAGLSVSELREPIMVALSQAKNEQELFKSIKTIAESAKINSLEDYRDLGVLLLELRQELRQHKGMGLKSRQDSLFLMEMLAEESLHVGSKKFANFPQEISIGSVNSTTGKAAALRNFQVQTGDVVLSKATGFGSSSFIALTMDHPHIYSHSTPVYVSNQGELLSPEADIEDGVKLRRMTKDYIDGSKTRMYIYRYQGAEGATQNKIEAGAQSLITDMYQRTEGDPFNKAAYKYDFSMTPGEVNSRGMFCSSVAYEMYVRAGLTGNKNPYAESVWSPISKSREELLKILNMNTNKVPAPGDLELNPEFRLVGARIDVSKLSQDRVEMAIIDTFLREIANNRETLQRVADVLNSLSSKPIDKEALKKMAASGILPKELADKAAMIDKIPDSINLKQMVFFAFLNEVMTPKLRGALMLQVSTLEKTGKIVGPVELRKMARAQGKLMLAELSKLEEKVMATTGVGFCGKVLL
ncbi:hypothetical protein [Bdellovibrio bacteriovorus]|uniref:hypothetical protein n=1 Tax=Bdellovibrio bacteriovorus TaxID=959 RepID=UPI0035A83E2E